MRQISSKATWWHKHAFPVIWFGFIGCWSVCWLVGVILQEASIFPLFFAVAMAVIGYFWMRLLFFPLVDEVWLEEDELIVRNRGREAHIPLYSVINVEATKMQGPEHITLLLREPSIFGREIVFAPSLRLFPYNRHPTANELLSRLHGLDEIDAA